jgi:hypothetical protein
MINAHSPAQLQPLNKEGELAKEGKKLDLNEELRVSPLCICKTSLQNNSGFPWCLFGGFHCQLWMRPCPSLAIFVFMKNHIRVPSAFVARILL